MHEADPAGNWWKRFGSSAKLIKHSCKKLFTFCQHKRLPPFNPDIANSALGLTLEDLEHFLHSPIWFLGHYLSFSLRIFRNLWHQLDIFKRALSGTNTNTVLDRWVNARALRDGSLPPFFNSFPECFAVASGFSVYS